MVERATVNRVVAGSSPALAASSGERTDEALARETMRSVGDHFRPVTEMVGGPRGHRQTGVGSERSSLTRSSSCGGVESGHARSGDRIAVHGEAGERIGHKRFEIWQAGVAPGPQEAFPLNKAAA